MRLRTGLAVLCAAWMVTGCEPIEKTEAPLPNEAAEVPSVQTVERSAIAPRGSDAILPAYALPGERDKPGKADSYDDFREANKQWYALTEAPDPGVAFRPMVEWEPAQQLWTTYSNGMVNDAPVAATIVDIIKHTVQDANTKVGVVVDTNTAYNSLRSRLTAAGVTNTQQNTMIDFFREPNNSIWFIDYGPIPMVRGDGSVAFGDFRYYHQRTLDDGLPTVIGFDYGVNTYRMPITTEGGNFQADGNGNCYTSTRGVQQSGLSVSQHEAVWNEYLGCQNLIVLKDITDDGTGHIDMFFKVVDDNSVIMVDYQAPYVNDSTNKARMDQNAALLESVIGANGQPLTVWRMPMPPKTQAIPRTYINSTFVNGVNLWPIYSASNTKAAQADAQAIWQQAMPTYDHIGIISDQIALYSGTIHCITRTIPVGALSDWVPDGTCIGGTCQTASNLSYSGECSASIPCDGPEWLCDLNFCGAGNPTSCEGYCGGQAPGGCYCDDLCAQYNDCCDDIQAQCVDVCVPNCAGKDCGSNGCSGSCGTCEDGNTCSVAGQCVAVCVPNCAGKQCGSNGCEGSCGNCSGGSTCNAAGQCVAGADPNSCVGNCGSQAPGGCWCDEQCVNYGDCCTDKAATCDVVVCVPDCAGKVCGDDGCGDSCGTCPGGATCNAGGQCVTQTDPNSCVGNCGDQAPGGCYCDEACVNYGDCCTDKVAACDTVCTPSCDGKSCGPDGRGGDCGECGNPIQCELQGDIDGSGSTTISDVQCVLLQALYFLGGQSGPAPGCAAGPSSHGDLDCSGALDVIDVNITISFALGKTLPSAIDANGDGCTDSCETAMQCSGGGQCVYSP